MPKSHAEKVIIDGLKTFTTNLVFKNNALEKENKELKKLLRQKKKLWVGLEDEHLREIGVCGSISYKWTMAAEEKLKELNT